MRGFLFALAEALAGPRLGWRRFRRSSARKAIVLKPLVVVTMFFVLATSVLLPDRIATAAPPADYDLQNGHFFTQTNGLGAADPSGFAVTNDANIPFWTEFWRFGGVPVLGYPISRRYSWDGFTVQAFQRGILQWRPDVQQAWVVNVFDLLHDKGKDGWLQSVRSTPTPISNAGDGGKPWAQVVRERQALLDANPAIKSQYFAVADPLTFYGLPTSSVVDNGSHYVIRLQRTVIQQWKVDVPWARAGQVTIANGGVIATEAGLVPAEVTIAEIPPVGGGRVVAIDPGHGGAEIGATYRFSDGTTILEKDLNLTVALKVADLLTRAGYSPILTRKTDAEVNKPPKLLTRKLPIGLDDELQARVDIANNSGAKLFLSIHFNGHPDQRLRGSEIYYCKERPYAADSLRFARLLLANLNKNLDLIGYHDDDAAVKVDSQALRPGEHFYLLGPANDIIVRPSSMPAALAEGLFVTNATDATKLRVERTLDVIARAYANAVNQYFFPDGVAQVPLAPSPSPTPPPKAQPTLGNGTILPQGATLRKQPSTSSPSLGVVAQGAIVTLLQSVSGEAVVSGDPKWYRVRTDLGEGYVYAQLIQIGGTSPPPASLGKGTVSVDFGGGAFLRSSPSSSADPVRAVPNGEVLDLLQSVVGEAVITKDTKWYRARYDGSEGFIYGQLIQVGETRSPPASLGKGTVSVDVGGGAFLRSSPSSSADPIRAVPNGEVLDLLQSVVGEAVIAKDTKWYRARYDGSEGFIYGPLVKTP